MSLSPINIIKGTFASKGSRRMSLKKYVAVSLFIALGFLTLILIAGLIVPKNVLLKISSFVISNSDDASTTESVNNNSTKTLPADQTSTSTSTQPVNTTTQQTTSTSPTTKPTTIPITQPSSPAGAAKVAPTLTFTGSPTSVSSGGSTVLSWITSANATLPVTCTGGGGSFAGSKAASGSQSVSLTSTTSYTLACTNIAGSSGTKTVTISVAAPTSTCGTSGGACTAAQIATHNTAANCWVIYNSNYLILSGSGVKGSNGNEVANHNGGSNRITPLCGGNATSAFTAQHGGQSGVKSIFNTYIVGPVI